MRKLMVVLAAVAFLAGASCLYAQDFTVNVIPNAVSSWDDLIGATIYVSIDKQASTPKFKGRVEIVAGPMKRGNLQPTSNEPLMVNHEVMSIVLTWDDVKLIRNSWEERGYFPVWVFLHGDGGVQRSIRHIVVNPKIAD